MFLYYKFKLWTLEITKWLSRDHLASASLRRSNLASHTHHLSYSLSFNSSSQWGSCRANMIRPGASWIHCWPRRLIGSIPSCQCAGVSTLSLEQAQCSYNSSNPKLSQQDKSARSTSNSANLLKSWPSERKSRRSKRNLYRLNRCSSLYSVLKTRNCTMKFSSKCPSLNSNREPCPSYSLKTLPQKHDALSPRTTASHVDVIN